MRTFIPFIIFGIGVVSTMVKISPGEASSVKLEDLPPLPADTVLSEEEKNFGYRGKIGGFMVRPSRYGIYFDDRVYYSGEDSDRTSIKIMYEKEEEGFCGIYVIIMGNLSNYKTMSFVIKGEKGGETFEIGLNDIISNKREDAVMAGSIYHYLPQGVTTQWQEVRIPLADFYGSDLSRVYSLVFSFNELGRGTFWVDEFRFSEEDLVDKEGEIHRRGFLLLDNFDHSDLNLLGRKANVYRKLPSFVKSSRVVEPHFGNKGRSLKLTYRKETRGWCGYYSLLNQIDGAYYDLRGYGTVSFMVKGEKGGEEFEIGMADRNWLIIGDSLKAGPIEKYLPQGVTTQWQEVRIPLEDFGPLDLSEMGSFVINFPKKGEGTIYIDELKFYLKEEESDERKKEIPLEDKI